MRRRTLLKLLAASALPLPRSLRAEEPPHVLVVGAGPAGVSAAIELAERGVRVTLVEAADRIGGKVEGWTQEQGEDSLDVEHGIHGFAGGYVHFTELLERYGLGGVLHRPHLWENGVRFGAEEGSLRPWNVGVILRHARKRAKELGYGNFWLEYSRGQRFLSKLTREEARRRWGGMSVTERFAQEDVPMTGYRLFPGMYSRSLYFVEPEQLDAGIYAISERFNRYDVRWMRGNPQEWIWEPFREVLLGLGVELKLRTRVSRLLARDGRVIGAQLGARRALPPTPLPEDGQSQLNLDGYPVFIDKSGEHIEARLGRCTHAGCPVQRAPEGFACPCHGGRYDKEGQPTAGPPKAPLPLLESKVEGGALHLSLPEAPEELRADAVILAVDAPAFSALAGPLLPKARGLKGCAHTVARFWFDRDVHRDARVAVVIDDADHCSNGFLIHRTQERSKAWAARTGGSVVEIQAFKDIPVGASEDEVLDLIEADVRRVWPELAEAGLLSRSLARGERFTWFFPGWHKHSTRVVTEVPGLLAAGDFVLVDRDCEFMERSVLTGRLAANVVLRAHGKPTATILPPLR